MASQSEFSRIVEIDDSILSKKLYAKANDFERADLAERFSLHSVNFMEIEYVVLNSNIVKGAYSLVCKLRAEVIKFTMADTDEKEVLDESFCLTLIDEENLKRNETVLRGDDIEIIDIKRPKIDIGEIAAQYLSLYVYM